MKVKERFLKLAGTLALCAALAFVPLQPAQAEEALPSVTVDSVTWDGGMLEVPIDLGSYAGEEDLSVNIIIPDDIPHGFGLMRHLWGEIEENKVIFSLWDLFGSSDSEYFFSKAGTYEMPMYFNVPDEEAGSGYTKVVSSDSFNLVIPSDSQQWKVPRTTVKFDGSEDIVFNFENGTNFFEIGSVNEIHVFLAKNIGFDMYDGYSFDAESGEVRINKNSFVNELKDYGKEWGAPEAKYEDVTVLIEVKGVTTNGIEIPGYINRVDYEGPEHFVTTIAWSVDLTGLDLSATDEVVTDGAATEFVSASSGEVSVSAATGNVIGQNALAYIQANYAEKLAGLDYYTVSARMELSEMDENNLDQAVKTAFAPYLTGRTAGKYYTIEIIADVMKDGQIVDGLGSILIPELSEAGEVTLKIPEDLKRNGRTYDMLHYQDGTAEILSCVEQDGTITFKTGGFSPFALVYRDAVDNAGGLKSTGNTAAGNNAVSPKTGDPAEAGYAAGVIVLSFAAIASVITLKRIRG